MTGLFNYCQTDVSRHQLYTIASLLHNRDLTLTIGTDTVAAADAVRVLYTGEARNVS